MSSPQNNDSNSVKNNNDAVRLHMTQSNHDKRRLYFVIGGLGLLIVVIIVLTAFLFNLRTSHYGDSQENRALEVTSVDRSIDDIQNMGDGKNAISASTISPAGGQVADGTIVYDFATHQVEGYAYKTIPVSGKGVAFEVTAEDASTQFTKIGERLRSGGFVQKSKNSDDAGGLQAQRAGLLSYETYVSDKTVCSLAHIDASKNMVGKHIVGSGCAEKSEYKKAAEQAKPFYDAQKAQRSSDKLLTVALLKSEDGSDGYRRAAVYQNAPSASDEMVVAFYYTQTKGGNWTYLTALAKDGSTPCTVYTSEEAKKAFKNTSCYDQQTKTMRLVGA